MGKEDSIQGHCDREARNQSELNSAETKGGRVFKNWGGDGGCRPSFFANWLYQKDK